MGNKWGMHRKRTGNEIIKSTWEMVVSSNVVPQIILKILPVQYWNSCFGESPILRNPESTSCEPVPPKFAPSDHRLRGVSLSARPERSKLESQGKTWTLHWNQTWLCLKMLDNYDVCMYTVYIYICMYIYIYIYIYVCTYIIIYIIYPPILWFNFFWFFQYYLMAITWQE